MLSKGAIAGIVIAIIVVLVGLVIGIYYGVNDGGSSGDRSIECSGVICYNGAKCDEEEGCQCEGNFGGIQCSECKHGWTGKNCDVSVPCDGKECLQGTCLNNRCRCNFGWAGENCGECANGFGPPGVCDEIVVTPCGDQNCIHGECQDGDVCKCDEGWTGPQCETQITLDYNNEFLGTWCYRSSRDINEIHALCAFIFGPGSTAVHVPLEGNCVRNPVLYSSYRYQCNVPNFNAYKYDPDTFEDVIADIDNTTPFTSPIVPSGFINH